ncbi:hypothetical protein MKW92_041325 [Papaver armeniacum]|nr:hypothetical protein MKW92_041325 [Papaver armeniacum]
MYAQNLELLLLVKLDGLEEIISTGFASEELNMFSKLNCLDLRSLRNLKCICDDNVNFFHLEKIAVKGCPELKKLPFNTSSTIPRTLKMIQGEEQWWERLEWEEIATKSNLAPYFRHS